MGKPTDLTKRYKPSEPCSCADCQAYCYHILGLWTVKQCRMAFEAALGAQMMLRLPPGYRQRME